MMTHDDLDRWCCAIRCILGDAAADVHVALGEVSVRVAPDQIVDVLQKLRDDEGSRLNQLIDLCAADYPFRAARFDVVYHLLSLPLNRRLRVKVEIEEGQALASVIRVFSSAGWFEREVWDLFGIPFSGHPDLRRILTDYGFDGHPLRKDFPLMGRTEVRYDPLQGRVVTEALQLRQDYRAFDFLSPWEAMTPPAPQPPKTEGEG